MKKFLAVLLVVAMVMALVPTMAFADSKASAYLHVEALEDFPSRPENQLNIVASIAAGDTVSFEFRPIGEATNDGGIFDVRTHDGARKLFYAKPSSSTPGTWNVNEQVGEAKNNGTVAMDTVSFTALDDGWYRVSFQVTVDLADGLHIAFGYYALDLDNLTVGDKTCSFDEANAVEFAEKNKASLKFDDDTEFTIERSVNGYDWAAALVVVAPSYLHVEALADFPSRPENQLNIVASIAAGDTVSFEFRPIGEATNDGGIFDVRTHDGARKLFYAKPSSSTPGTWSVNEQVGEAKNNGTVAMDTVSFTALDDGWYRVSFQVTVDLADGLHIAFGYYALDMDNLTVGDKTCSFDDVNVVEFAEKNKASLKFDDDTEFTIERSVNGYDWVASLAPADEVIWIGYEMPAKSSSRNTIFVEYEFKTGDVVSFLIYIGESAEVDKTDMYVRKSAKALYLGTDDEVYSGKHIVDYALPLLYEGEETGWYYIECVLQEDVSELEFSVDGGNVTDGAIGATAVANITVNGVALDETTVVTDSNSNVVEPDLLDATGIELPTRDALQLIVTGAGATVVVKDIDGNVVNPGEEALTEKYEYTIEVEALEGFVVTGILVNGEEFESGKSIIADEGIEVMVATTRIFAPDVTAENATVVLKDAEGNVLEGDIDEGTEVVVEVEVAEGYELVSVTVNGEAYEAGTTVIVVEGLVVEVVTAEEVVEVEPTGAVSMAVVAVMAVLGGAVVLKKREF